MAESVVQIAAAWAYLSSLSLAWEMGIELDKKE